MSDEIQDLTQLNATPARAAIAGAPSTSIIDEPYDPTRDREEARGKIALALVWTLIGVVAFGALVAVITMWNCVGATPACSAETYRLDPIRAVFELLLTPLVGLVGAVTGFYFGEKSGQPRGA